MDREREYGIGIPARLLLIIPFCPNSLKKRTFFFHSICMYNKQAFTKSTANKNSILQCRNILCNLSKYVIFCVEQTNIQQAKKKKALNWKIAKNKKTNEEQKKTSESL